MNGSIVRRIEELEEELARDRASRIRYRLVWVDPETGERTDADGEVIAVKR